MLDNLEEFERPWICLAMSILQYEFYILVVSVINTACQKNHGSNRVNLPANEQCWIVLFVFH